MNTQKAKFELFSRLQALGFTYEEAVALRRIEMTLHRWSEAECNGDIQRDETSGKAYRHTGQGTNGPFLTYAIADREAGALKRLSAIVAARNARQSQAEAVISYHQTDPRGCALYLVRYASLCSGTAPIDQVYPRGLAVCA